MGGEPVPRDVRNHVRRHVAIHEHVAIGLAPIRQAEEDRVIPTGQARWQYAKLIRLPAQDLLQIGIQADVTKRGLVVDGDGVDAKSQASR